MMTALSHTETVRCGGCWEEGQLHELPPSGTMTVRCGQCGTETIVSWTDGDFRDLLEREADTT